MGEDIRQIGSDIKAGQVVLEKGDLINPAEIGILATCGITQLPVSHLWPPSSHASLGPCMYFSTFRKLLPF